MTPPHAVDHPEAYLHWAKYYWDAIRRVRAWIYYPHFADESEMEEELK